MKLDYGKNASHYSRQNRAKEDIKWTKIGCAVHQQTKHTQREAKWTKIGM